MSDAEVGDVVAVGNEVKDASVVQYGGQVLGHPPPEVEEELANLGGDTEGREERARVE